MLFLRHKIKTFLILLAKEHYLKYRKFLIKLLFTSLFYSLSTDPVTNPLLQSFSTQLGIQTDNQVSTLNSGISSLKDAYSKQFSTMSSFVNRGIPDAVNEAFSSFTSTTNTTFVSYSTSIGTAQSAADSAYTIVTNCNNYLSTTLSTMIDYQYDNLAYLSTEIGTPLLYRPQTFYQIDILLNNSSLSSVFFNQSNNYEFSVFIAFEKVYTVKKTCHFLFKN